MMSSKQLLFILFFVVISLMFDNNAIASTWLFKDSRSSYQIVLPKDASLSEKKAAQELQVYLYKISGANLPITSEYKKGGKNIIVGYTPEVAQLTGAPKPPKDDESFAYRRIGNNLLIWGGRQRGTMYGVFTFLERELGIHWLTPECTVIPKYNRWRLKRLNHSESPAIKYRYNNYFVSNGSPAWSAHVKENMRGVYSEEFGGQEDYWGCHTMGQFVSVSEFYGSHPEYFCLRGGKRLSKDEQLCLSNPNVLKICKERLAKTMRERTNSRIYCLSQNDNYNFCECESCAAIENQYGGHSGLILWFVNQVADAVYDEFPEKYVGTFAYQYSRKPPVGIAPRKNVVVRLCSLECCFAHPLTSGCRQNESFMNDLKGWSAIAPRLFVWDYIVDFAQYLAPWPNFQVLAPNIRAFRDNNAIGVFEEAHFSSCGGEFEEMKSWVVNQLLWNPEQDVDSLVNIFIKGYYGKTASLIKKYYDLCQKQLKPDLHFGIFIKEDHILYNDDFILKAFTILDKALYLADNDEVKQRVARVRMQPLYLYCMRNKEQAKRDGKLNELIAIMRKYNANPGGGRKLEDFVLSQK